MQPARANRYRSHRRDGISFPLCHQLYSQTSADDHAGLAGHHRRRGFGPFQGRAAVLRDRHGPDRIVSEEIYKKLLFDKLEVNKGMIVENIVAQMLIAGGHKLYFYSNSSRDDVTSRMEIDFLIARNKIGNRHNMSPIEVKSSKNYTLTSLKKFKNKFSQQLNVAYVLHSSDLKEENGITYLPLYMTPLL